MFFAYSNLVNLVEEPTSAIGSNVTEPASAIGSFEEAISTEPASAV